MNGHAISLLGTGLIGDFYTNTLHGQRGRDRVRVVYSRSLERGPSALQSPRKTSAIRSQSRFCIPTSCSTRSRSALYRR